MTSLLSSEFYKISKNIYVIIALILLVVVYPLSSLISEIDTRAVLLLDIYEISLFFIVGSVWGAEYTNCTIKNIVINHSRTNLFFAKALIILIIVIFSIVLSTISGYIFSTVNYNVNMIISQATAIITHTFILISASQIFTGFAALSLVSIIIFFIYHFCLTINQENILYNIVEKSPPFLFTHSYFENIPHSTFFTSITVILFLFLISLIIFKRKKL